MTWLFPVSADSIGAYLGSRAVGRRTLPCKDGGCPSDVQQAPLRPGLAYPVRRREITASDVPSGTQRTRLTSWRRRNVGGNEHAGLVSQTTQTLILAGSTLAAVIVTFIGSHYLLRWQTRKEAQARTCQAVGEVLAAATDLINGLRVFRAAHARRTTGRYYLRLAATFLPGFSRCTGWRDLGRWENLKPIYDSALQMDRDLTDQQRTIVLDLSKRYPDPPESLPCGGYGARAWRGCGDRRGGA